MTSERESRTAQSVVYLTTLACSACGELATIAHDGPIIPLDQDAPWPEATSHCPNCGESYPDDLSAQIYEVHEARRVSPFELRKMAGDSEVVGDV